MASPGIPLRGPHDPGERAGRFHTARGRMGISGWARYPAAWLRARRGITPERPWMVPAAIGWLRRRIRPDWSILELGAGRSTIWFAGRAGRVVSLEDNAFWAGRTRVRSKQLGLQNVEVREFPVDRFAAEVEALPEGSFELVVMDFLESAEVTRIDVLRPAMKRVAPGGFLLLDDSDRPGYAEAFELLGHWPFKKFVGVKDGWPQACETGIFRRPK